MSNDPLLVIKSDSPINASPDLKVSTLHNWLCRRCAASAEVGAFEQAKLWANLAHQIEMAVELWQRVEPPKWEETK